MSLYYKNYESDGKLTSLILIDSIREVNPAFLELTLNNNVIVYIFKETLKKSTIRLKDDTK